MKLVRLHFFFFIFVVKPPITNVCHWISVWWLFRHVDDSQNGKWPCLWIWEIPCSEQCVCRWNNGNKWKSLTSPCKYIISIHWKVTMSHTANWPLDCMSFSITQEQIVTICFTSQLFQQPFSCKMFELCNLLPIRKQRSHWTLFNHLRALWMCQSLFEPNEQKIETN